jgi:acyl-CoA thioesterase-1
VPFVRDLTCPLVAAVLPAWSSPLSRRALLGTLVASLLLLAGTPACKLQLPAEPQARPLVYVALGASDAVGIGATDPTTDGWVPQLHSRMPPGTQLVNLGVSGSLLRDALVQQLPVAIDAYPDVVTVWLVVNDFNARVPLDEYIVQLDTLLSELHQKTRARIAVANVPDLAVVPAYRAVDPRALRAEIARWNEAIAQVCAQHGAILVDLSGTWQELAANPDYVSADGFHPSSTGYRRLADVFWDALMQGGFLEQAG